MAIVKGASKAPATGQLFTLWLATKGQGPLAQFASRVSPLVPGSEDYEMAKGKPLVICGADCIIGRSEYDKLHSDILQLPGIR